MEEPSWLLKDLIAQKRAILGLSAQDFADYLGVNGNGKEKVLNWEDGVSLPSKAIEEKIVNLSKFPPPYRQKKKKPKFDFIDLFAGIGGIRIPFQELGGRCVFTSEWDKHAKVTYAANFGEYPKGDITKISSNDIPPHDLLLGGFPCQAFSQAGLKGGFTDSRGTLFFEIQRILANKRPKAFLLENVKQLRGHKKGETLRIILDILRGSNDAGIPKNITISKDAKDALSSKLNYEVFVKVLRARDFGVPQNRERIFICGFDKDYFGKNVHIPNHFEFPIPTNEATMVGDILEDSSQLDEYFTLSDKLWDGHKRRKEEHQKKGNGFGYSLFSASDSYTNTISARYYKDGSEILIDQTKFGKNPRKLTPRECARLQGFPEDFIVDAVSASQAYKQFGNSVTVPVIRAIAENLVECLNKCEKAKKLGKKETPKLTAENRQIDWIKDIDEVA
jgi:DNA (cytosine-5)-methyltransferase 1